MFKSKQGDTRSHKNRIFIGILIFFVACSSAHAFDFSGQYFETKSKTDELAFTISPFRAGESSANDVLMKSYPQQELIEVNSKPADYVVRFNTKEVNELTQPHIASQLSDNYFKTKSSKADLKYTQEHCLMLSYGLLCEASAIKKIRAAALDELTEAEKVQVNKTAFLMTNVDDHDFVFWGIHTQVIFKRKALK